ncbi:Na+/H+ antiporter [Gluconacetobacter diazotrophicus PA1 5]|uniref:Na+/H+ antiporter n=1 Tax=Gluconacetobacter diazotrophicus TaxID=33996 RepID=A0A7W4NFV2_GLUDI|nr:Na+/H+ antiporter [Gluconacetobacter diazotrophicus]ACI52097.1 Na+/H+ antiporter [Gluconacetobacter diazotrophicus PA1 5]MBB2156971.1 Na+/H+ antiporter [Gluconacetobacter diazotrophicus]TWB02806.1 sodium/proton antiporter (CPA1 family) [Gluconacetobacter diazotrophicus]
MHDVIVGLILLFVAAISSLFSRLLPVPIPLPLWQIALGVVGSVAGLHVVLNPDMFMLLFIPPLLFRDAFRMPTREFGQLRGIIFALAVPMVVGTTILCGYAVHWLIPVLALPACFALAAVLSPTDAVAVGGMLGPSVPRTIVHVLDGESLLNDASGLVCFRFAAVAAVTGAFSLRGALATFGLLSLGGIAIGILVCYAAARLDRMLLRRGYDDPPTQVTFMLLLPFAAYLLAELVGCSGILAAVAGGMTAKLTGVLQETQITTRLQARTTWDMVGFVFNSIIFLLLGLQLPDLAGNGIALVRQAGRSPWLLLLVIVAIHLAMCVLRFAGLWIILAVAAWRARHERGAMHWPGLRTVLVGTVAGVRGAVTLAAVLSLPQAVGDVPGFPDRDLLVTLATGVILVSLLAASLTLPWLARGMPAGQVDPQAREVDWARLVLLRTMIRAMRDEQAALTARAKIRDEAGETRIEIIARLMQEYENRLGQLQRDGDGAASAAQVGSIRRMRLELAIRLTNLRASRIELRNLRAAQYVNDETESLLQQEMDYEEQVLRNRARTLPRVA